MRRAYVPLDAASYGEPNPLSDWTRANFDAQALARHFREIGLTPGGNWWSADREAMFAAAPSPRAVLTENAKVIRLVERFFGKLKHARGLATRYDKRADNFLAAIKLFSTRLWINGNESTP